MKEIALKILACILSLAMLLAGNLGSMWQDLMNMGDTGVPREYVAFEDMEYHRPDLDAMEKQLEICLTGAENDWDVSVLLEKVEKFLDMYNDYATCYSLANIHYSMDVTDEYWLEEYNFCMENATTADSSLDKLLYALADCDLKDELEADEMFGEGFFDDYQGESIWDDTFTALMDQENALLSEYYTITAEAADTDPYSDEYYNTYGRQIAEVYVKMIDVRQDIAAYRGYGNYMEFAYDYYYSRDYTPDQAIAYMNDIRDNLADMYWDIPYDAWDASYDSWSSKKTFSYVKECAKAMGGTVWEAFGVMEAGGYYDIEPSANKYDASFETYLRTYEVPYIFMNAQGNGQDPLTFAHEFGHFCNEYAAGGSDAGIDVMEIFSQAMELMSLLYCEDTESLAKMQMASLLDVFIFQSLYASFEHQVYLLDKDELTAENVQELFLETAYSFGFAIDARVYIHIPHFFIAPMYVISYVTSADAALQIFQMEENKTGAGLKLYQENLDTKHGELLEFLDAAGLESPFYRGRAAQIRRTLKKYLE